MRPRAGENVAQWNFLYCQGEIVTTVQENTWASPYKVGQVHSLLPSWPPPRYLP